MISEIKNMRISKKDIRKFAITVGIALAVIGVFLFWKSKDIYKYFLIISVFLFGAGIIAPIILKPLYFIWMTFATILGWIMSNIILSILFYVIFTLISNILKLFGKRFLDLKFDKLSNSYWNYRENNQVKSDQYEHQF